MIEAVILTGPSTEMFPIANSRLPKICLPIMNQSMILHMIKLLEEVSIKITVVGLSEDESHFEKVIKNHTGVRVEYICIEAYEGSVSLLLDLYPKITEENVIVCKGDIITNIDVLTMVSSHLNSKRMLTTVLNNAVLECSVVGYQGDNLMFYGNDDSEDIPFQLLKNPRGITLTKELDVVPFYIFRKSLFKMFERKYFSFRHGLLPKLVKELSLDNPVWIYKPKKNYIHRVRTPEEYLKINTLLKRHVPGINAGEMHMSEIHARFVREYVKKYNLKDFKNVVGNDTKVKDVLLLNSILGHGCNIGEDSKIISSLLMDEINIGPGTHIEGSVLGSGVSVVGGSILVNCKVSPGYTFQSVVDAKSKTFS